MSRLNIERQDEQQPKRVEFAVKQLEDAGYPVHFKNETTVKFFFGNEEVVLFPYSGWHSGKSITDGRGIMNLLKQIKK